MKLAFRNIEISSNASLGYDEMAATLVAALRELRPAPDRLACMGALRVFNAFPNLLRENRLLDWVCNVMETDNVPAEQLFAAQILMEQRDRRATRWLMSMSALSHTTISSVPRMREPILNYADELEKSDVLALLDELDQTTVGRFIRCETLAAANSEVVFDRLHKMLSSPAPFCYYAAYILGRKGDDAGRGHLMHMVQSGLHPIPGIVALSHIPDEATVVLLRHCVNGIGIPRATSERSAATSELMKQAQVRLAFVEQSMTNENMLSVFERFYSAETIEIGGSRGMVKFKLATPLYYADDILGRASKTSNLPMSSIGLMSEFLNADNRRAACVKQSTAVRELFSLATRNELLGSTNEFITSPRFLWGIERYLGSSTLEKPLDGLRLVLEVEDFSHFATHWIVSPNRSREVPGWFG